MHASTTSPLILAGDIGGTSTRLALFAVGGSATPTLERRAFGKFVSREHAGLVEIVAAFLKEHPASLAAAGFGVAGPERDGVVRTPNLPWIVDVGELARTTGTARVLLVNDLVANAWGILGLGPSDFELLGGPAVASRNENAAVVSAGTGLGEAGICWDGARHHPMASEGGHGDLAPRDDEEYALLRFLQKRFGRAVSYERVLSGPGLVNIYEFLRDTGRGVEQAEVRGAMRTGDAAAVISTAALAGTCAMCDAALDRFVSIYGAEAGNAALRYLALGGVYLGGGIAPRILPRLRNGAFMASFLDKGRMRPLLETIPVRVVLNDGAALLGAGRAAAQAALDVGGSGSVSAVGGASDGGSP